MRVLIGMSGWTQSLQPETCIGIRHTQAYNLAKQLRLRGVEVVYCNVGPTNMDLDASVKYYAATPIPEADHALVVEPIAFCARTFNQEKVSILRPNRFPMHVVGDCPFLDAVRRRVSGCVATISNSHCNGLGMEDVTFYEFEPEALDAYREQIPPAPQCRKIGWAADGQVFSPRQVAGRVQVLIDHPHYGSSQQDQTDRLVASLKGVHVDVRRLGRADVEPVNPATFGPTERYNASIAHTRLARIHGEAHVFATTHRESQGLSVLEAAMCGSLIVAKRGHIQPVLLNPLRHCLYHDVPDWAQVLEMVDPQKCREAALPFDRWDEVGEIIYDTFVGWT